jgi:hypothetical protein
MSSLDPVAADSRASTGIASAVAHSGPTWQSYAMSYIRIYLTHHRELFCDDVWSSGLTVPASPRAFGQVMKGAIRAGWMTASGRGRRSAQSNNSVRSIYTSNLYDPTSTVPYPTPPPDPDTDTDPEPRLF